MVLRLGVVFAGITVFFAQQALSHNNPAGTDPGATNGR